MIGIVLRRLAMSALMLVVVSFLTFVLVALTPGSAVYTILGQGATDQEIAHLQTKLGLDRPLLVQYGDWLGRAVTGDLGKSLISRQPVTTAISQRLAPTLSLLLVAIVVITVIGVALGVVAATHRGVLARLIDVFSFGGLAVPNFVFALYLIPLFALTLGWLPASGYVRLEQSPGDWLRSLVLPVMALAVGAVGIVAKQTRAAMDEVLGREFVMMMRANGYRQRSIVYRHALKTAAVPILAVVGVMFVSLISGTILVETVFGYPGLGGLAVQASSQADVPMVEGVTVVFTLFVVVLNLALDICYAVLNPKASVS